MPGGALSQIFSGPRREEQAGLVHTKNFSRQLGEIKADNEYQYAEAFEGYVWNLQTPITTIINLNISNFIHWICRRQCSNLPNSGRVSYFIIIHISIKIIYHMCTLLHLVKRHKKVNYPVKKSAIFLGRRINLSHTKGPPRYCF